MVQYVNEDYRWNKLSEKLLVYVERMAKKKDPSVSMLDTFAFQTEDFYYKNGYIPRCEINKLSRSK